MATTPETLVAPTTLVQSWLQRHERIVIVALVLLAGSWAFSRYADISAARADARANAAEQTLATQKAADAQNQATIAQVTQQYAAIVQSLQAQNSALANAVASRQASVAAQQRTDSTLPLVDLANRLKTLGNAPEGAVLTTGNYVEFTQPGAVAVVQTLETIPALQADLKDETTLAGAAQAAQKQGEVVIADQSKQIDGLNLTLVDADKQCKAQVAEVKAQARKSKSKLFKVGVFVGFLGGLFAGHSGL